MKNSFHSARGCARKFFVDIMWSEKPRGKLSFEEQILYQYKYPCIFSSQVEAYPSNIIRSVRNETYVISLLSKTDVDFYSNFITTTLFSSLETAPTLSPNLIPPLEEDCDRIGRKV